MNALIGDKFPHSHRESFCNQNIKLGAVFRLYTSLTTPAKVKRFVIIGIKKEINSIGLLFINSHLSNNILKNKYLQRFHHPLEEKGRDFLDQNSYLDCSQLYENNYDILLNKCIADINIYLGAFNNTDLAIAQNHVKSAKTIKRRLKRRYGLTQ